MAKPPPASGSARICLRHLPAGCPCCLSDGRECSWLVGWLSVLYVSWSSVCPLACLWSACWLFVATLCCLSIGSLHVHMAGYGWLVGCLSACVLCHPLAVWLCARTGVAGWLVGSHPGSLACLIASLPIPRFACSPICLVAEQLRSVIKGMHSCHGKARIRG